MPKCHVTPQHPQEQIQVKSPVPDLKPINPFFWI
ncbi:unnamed protein product [Arabidopsis halleri]